MIAHAKESHFRVLQRIPYENARFGCRSVKNCFPMLSLILYDSFIMPWRDRSICDYELRERDAVLTRIVTVRRRCVTACFILLIYYLRDIVIMGGSVCFWKL